jgi:Inhibitor of apoptosis-promoting Bax1
MRCIQVPKLAQAAAGASPISLGAKKNLIRAEPRGLLLPAAGAALLEIMMYSRVWVLCICILSAVATGSFALQDVKSTQHFAPAHAALLTLRGGQREPRFPTTKVAPVGIQQSTLSKTSRRRPDENMNLDATVEELEQQEAKYADAFLVRDSRRMQTVFWSSFAVSLGSIVALQSKKELRQKAPANIALLSLFTIAESAAVSCITLLYQTKSVWLALLQTSAATLGLSLYAFNTNPKYDLSGIGSACSSGLIILLLFGVLRMVFPG